MVMGGYDGSLVQVIATGATSVKVLSQNVYREWALFTNDDESVIIYLSLDKPAQVGQGIRLNAGGGWFAITKLNPFHGDIYAISSASLTDKLLIVEVTK